MTGSQCGVCGAPASTLGAPDATTGLKLGGWWRRVGATITDDVILVIPTVLVADLFAAMDGTVLGIIAGVAVQGIYMVLLLASPRGQTIGNRIAASRVRDAVTGQAISRQQAVRRWGFVAAYGVVGTFSVGVTVPTLLVTVVGLADILYPLFNSRKQTLHDRFANTIVVMA